MKRKGLLIGFLLLSAMLYAQDGSDNTPTGSDNTPTGSDNTPTGSDNTPTVTIDGLLYKLSEATNTAMVANDNTWDGELVIPEEVNYEGKSYTVDRIEWLAFNSCKTLTKVRIPKTIVDIKHYDQFEDCKNPFTGCTSLESIEVDEANPNMCSVEGVLFNKDTTWLFCYPAGLRSETYTVPDGVSRLGGNAFAYNPYLLSVQMSNSVTYMAFGIFSNCKNLKSIQLSENIKYIDAYTFESCDSLRFLDIPESVTGFAEGVFRWSPLETILIRGTFPDDLRYDTFYFLDEERTVIYCHPSEIDKFKTVFKGSVLPLGDWTGIYYRPLISDNKEWTTAYLGAVPPEYQHIFSYEQIKLDSTIEVDGMTLKQIVRSQWNYGEDGPTNWKETEMYIGEVDGKVYFYDHWSTNYHLVQVMDFTLQEGDTYRQHTSNDDHDDYADFVVVAVTDTVIATSVDKTPRKCLYIGRVGESKIYDVWVEGIGSLVSGVYGTYSYFMNGAIPTLRTCKEDGQTLYEAYHPLLKEGKRWNCQEYYSNGWTGEQWTKDVSYVINGTVEIDGKKYYKMYRISEDENKYYCALREEDKKVWQYDKNYNGDLLLYDFGMSVGDSYMLSYYDSYNYQLTAIKPMRFQYDQLFNVFYYNILEQWDPASPNYVASAPIVEGVGCEEGWKIMELYAIQPTNGIIHGESFLSCYEDGKCIFTADDFNELTNTKPDDNMAYRPMIEEGKVWKVGTISGNPVQVVDYYYFDGDTIIDGKTCKQMWCQRLVSSDYSNEYWTPTPSLTQVGAWYEKDKKVYFYDERKQAMVLKYDFSVGANESLQLIDDCPPFIIDPRQTGGIEGFKGVYRDVMINQNVRSTTWLEGVGGIDGPIRNAYPEAADPVPEFLMSCTVGDEVIYLNSEYADGATPEIAKAPKNRFDFTHIIKTKPKVPTRRVAYQSPYGEYNDLRVDINLYSLDDAYLIRIADDSGKTAYEKAVNASSIIGLNIDISSYPKGLYTVIVENSNESFIGQFEAQTTGIEEVTTNSHKTITNYSYYNLQGQRLSSLRKGLNIVNGKKVYVK